MKRSWHEPKLFGKWQQSVLLQIILVQVGGYSVGCDVSVVCHGVVIVRPRVCLCLSWYVGVWFRLQCFDAVGWVAGRASGL